MRHFTWGIACFLSVIAAALLVYPSGAITVKTGPSSGDRSDIDGIGTESDINFIKTANWPGNLDVAHLTEIFVSPDSGGLLPLGYDFVCGSASTQEGQGCDELSDCSDGVCDNPNYWADKNTPLRSLSGAHHMFERNGCGAVVWLDSGDSFDNLAIGDNNSAFVADGGWDGGATTNDINCNDTTNERVGLVISPWPRGTRVDINFCAQRANAVTDGLDGPNCDVILVGDSAGTDVVADADMTAMVADAFNGMKLMATDVSDAGCPLTLGDQRDIDDGTTTTLTVDPAFGGDVEDCVFTVISENFSGNSPNHEHFAIQLTGSDNDSQAIMINLDLHNCNEADCISQSSKDPGVSLGLWGVTIHNELVATGARLLHTNSPSTTFAFQTRVLNAKKSIVWDSSGPVLSIGSQFMSADTSTAQSLVKTSAFADAIIDSELIVAYPGVGTDDRKGWEFNCNTAIAGDCNNWLIRSRIINQQNTAGVGALASSVASGTTGWSFRCLYSSIAKVGSGLVVNTTQLGSTRWDVFMRACLFSDIADAIFKVTGDDLDTVNLDIQDMTYDDTGSNEWDMETADIDTLALAQDDIEANSVGAFCGGIACTESRVDK
jgi:hypothetical protein